MKIKNNKILYCLLVLTVLFLSCGEKGEEKTKDKELEKTSLLLKEGTNKIIGSQEGGSDEFKDIGYDCGHHKYIINTGEFYRLRFDKRLNIYRGDDYMEVELKLASDVISGVDIELDELEIETYDISVWCVDRSEFTSNHNVISQSVSVSNNSIINIFWDGDIGYISANERFCGIEQSNSLLESDILDALSLAPNLPDSSYSLKMLEPYEDSFPMPVASMEFTVYFESDVNPDGALRFKAGKYTEFTLSYKLRDDGMIALKGPDERVDCYGQ